MTDPVRIKQLSVAHAHLRSAKRYVSLCLPSSLPDSRAALLEPGIELVRRSNKSMQKVHTLRPAVRAVLFDLDNTLVHRNQSISRYASRFVDDFAHSLASVSPDTVAWLVNRQDNGGYLPSDSPFPTVRAAIAHSLVLDLPWRQIIQQEEIATHWANCFPECTVEMEGADALCDRLVALGMRIGIVSNGAEKSRLATVERLSFRDRLSSVLSSERAGVRKPNAAIFQAAGRQLGVANDECVYVGDHPINDIAGALSAGMGAIWLEGFHLWPGEVSVNVPSVTSLSQVLDFVVEISARVTRGPSARAFSATTIRTPTGPSNEQ